MATNEISGEGDSIVNELPVETKEKKKIHPGMKKNLLVIGGVLLGAIALTAVSGLCVWRPKGGSREVKH